MRAILRELAGVVGDVTRESVPLGVAVGLVVGGELAYRATRALAKWLVKC